MLWNRCARSLPLSFCGGWYTVPRMIELIPRGKRLGRRINHWLSMSGSLSVTSHENERYQGSLANWASCGITKMAASGLTQEQLEKFDKDGYLVIEDFCPEDVESLRKEMHDILENMDLSENPKSVFVTGKKQVGDDYFLTSGDKIRAFFEEGAFDSSGKLVKDRHLAINKVGHALHTKNPVFKKLTFSNRIQAIGKSLGLKNPIVPQSMYIFKQPGIGGEVVPHRDSTYLYTHPPSALGMWIPLEDCTLENGCLWFIPGSHKVSEIHRRMIRTPDAEVGVVKHIGPEEEFPEKDAIPACTKKGYLVLIHGAVLHRSLPNKSSKSRHAYTFHIVDGNAKWDEQNWLQPTAPFPPLY